MEKSLYFLAVFTAFMLVAGSSFAQKIHTGYESWVTKKGSQSIRYTRELVVGKDDIGKEATHTPVYTTRYNLFNGRGELFLNITIVNYKKRDIVEIYMIPITIAREKDFDNMTTYKIGADEFEGLKFIESGIYGVLGSRMSEIDIAYVSNKKEHLMIRQIMDGDATDRLHYKLDNY